MSQNFQILFLLVGLLLAGCSVNNKNENNTEDSLNIENQEGNLGDATQNIKLPKQQIVFEHKINQQNNGEIAFFIPNNPSSVVVLFDAQGRGFFPLAKYKALAEKYGLVLIGSNISKNGYPYAETQAHFQLIKQFIAENFPNIEKNTHLGGFSGGGRVAAWLAFDFEYASVFGCGAGVPNNDKNIINNKFYYATTGTYDFNYRELNSLTEGFVALNQFVAIFEGDHQWPPRDEMDWLFLWLKFNEIRLGNATMEVNEVEGLKKNYIQSLQNNYANQSTEIYYNAISKGSAIFHDVTDISYFEDLKNQFRSQQKWANFSKQTTIAKFAEGGWTGKFGYALEEENTIKLWNEYITDIENEIENAPNQIIKKSFFRALNFAELVGFLKMGDAYKTNNLNEMQQFMDVVERIDNKNADLFYYKALLAAKQNKTTEAESLLKQAIQLGYADYKQLQQEQALHQLDVQKFVDLIQQTEFE